MTSVTHSQIVQEKTVYGCVERKEGDKKEKEKRRQKEEIDTQ